MSLFNTIKIRTPESVELEFSLAGIGSRAVALAVDYALLGLMLLGLLLIWIFLMVQLEEASTIAFVSSDNLQLWVMAIFSVLMFGLYVGYFIGFETYWHGQSPGKRYARIRVIRDDGQPERLLQATLRSLLRPVDDILFVGFFFILLGSREKRIGDWLAGTLVVQIDPGKAGREIKTSDRACAIGLDLLNLMNFDPISPDDFATVRTYLQRRPTLTSKAHEEVSLHLARRLKEKAGLESLPVEMTADTFLEAVYWAYQRKGEEREDGVVE